jgi:hypothetical protein
MTKAISYVGINGFPAIICLLASIVLYASTVTIMYHKLSNIP